MNDARERSSVRVVVVDDLEISRAGTAVVLGRIRDVEVVGLFDFDGALRQTSWDDCDWVVVDIAAEGRPRDEVPSAAVIERVRQPAGPDRPTVIAVTSNPVAFDEDVIRRRLLEAGADDFVRRSDLDRAVCPGEIRPFIRSDRRRFPVSQDTRSDRRAWRVGPQFGE